MRNIIVRPLITEKNTLRAGKLNEYAFEVVKSANRSEIKKAIEKLFKVKVERVNTMIARHEKSRRMSKGGSIGGRRLWKKALVKLKEGDKFDFVAN